MVVVVVVMIRVVMQQERVFVPVLVETTQTLLTRLSSVLTTVNQPEGLRCQAAPTNQRLVRTVTVSLIVYSCHFGGFFFILLLKICLSDLDLDGYLCPYSDLVRDLTSLRGHNTD